MLKVPGIAKGLGCSIVTTFMGSPIWPFIYGFPPTSGTLIEEGYGRAAELWTPILDAFASAGVSLALEPHPSELAFDWYSTERLVKALHSHPAFGLNVDPSHLFWQGVDPADFVRGFAPLVRHVHMKDLALRPNGRRGILGSHLPFGDSRRAWNFRSVGRGDIDFEELLRALDEIGYEGPLSIEWEDNDMERVEGAAESLSAVRALQRSSPLASFDSQTASYPRT
jgi:sugar phosphate isomerase/epimerase